MSCSLGFSQANSTIWDEWTSSDKESRLQFKIVNNKPEAFISWLKSSKDFLGNEYKDSKNPNPKLRGRKLIGLQIITDFVKTSDNSYKADFYDVESGSTYPCWITLKKQKYVHAQILR
jgi:uncharacterized protein (DUF2147 family)